MKWTVCLVLLLLCACATQRQKGVGKEAVPAASNRVAKLYAPAVHPKPTISPVRTALSLQSDRAADGYTSSRLGKSAIPYTPRVAPRSASVQRKPATRILYLRDTLAIDSLSRELEIEQLANQAIRKRLKSTESERDYWQDKNEQKFWTLIAMAVFAFLYILFRVLASRIKET